MKKLKSFLNKNRGETAENSADAAPESETGSNKDRRREGVRGKSSVRKVPKDPAHKPQDPDIPAWCMEGQDERDPRQDGHERGALTRTGGQKRTEATVHNIPSDAPSRTVSRSRECVICQGGGDGEWRVLPCAHSFHTACLERWIAARSSCPVCRTEFDFSEDGSLRRREAATRSTALVESSGELAAFHQFQELMDPNNLARAVVPRSVHNYLDRLPTPERFEAEGLYTLLPPTQQFFSEVQEDVGVGISRLLRGDEHSGGATNPQLEMGGNHRLEIEDGRGRDVVSKTKRLQIEDGRRKEERCEQSTVAAGRRTQSRERKGEGGRKEEDEEDRSSAVAKRVQRLETKSKTGAAVTGRGGGGGGGGSVSRRAARPVMPGAQNVPSGGAATEEVTVSV